MMLEANSPPDAANEPSLASAACDDVNPGKHPMAPHVAQARLGAASRDSEPPPEKAAKTAATNAKPKRVCRFQLLSVEDLDALPDPAWLLDGIIPEGAFVELYGKPGVGKSFLALGWTLSTAAGRQWLGRKITQGDALYISAEGGTGLKKRIAAWRSEHRGADIGTFKIIPEPVNMLDKSAVGELILAIKEKSCKPRLVVIDTLARCFGGGDENFAKDMNAFVAGADAIKSEFPKATILVVHHTGKNPNRGDRGSSALRAAADTVMELSGENLNALTLKCEKQKDSEPFRDNGLSLKIVNLYPNGTSCIITSREQSITSEARSRKPARGKENGSDAKALDALRDFGPKGATYNRWREACGLPDSTFKNARKRLLQDGLVHHFEKLYRAANSDEGQGQGQDE